MAKAKSNYVCQECGATHPKWMGRCDACGAWNSLTEEAGPESAPKGLGGKRGKKIQFVDLDGHEKTHPAASPVSPNSTGSSAAVWCRVQPCWSAATPGSANQPF